MKNIVAALVMLTTWVAPEKLLAQVDEDELGAWYMYFFNARVWREIAPRLNRI